MSYLKHLPDNCRQIAADAGWDDDSIIILLLGFINEKNIDGLPTYLETVAKEEREFTGEADA